MMFFKKLSSDKKKKKKKNNEACAQLDTNATFDFMESWLQEPNNSRDFFIPKKKTPSIRPCFLL